MLLSLLTASSFSQNITYGQLHDYIQFNWNKEANDTIYCDEFFSILDTVTANAFITYDCAPYPGLKDYRQVVEVPNYPDSIDIYEISGRVLVYTLIDTSGNLACYQIKTQLGDRFVKEVERVLSEMNFVQAKCGGVSKAYHFSFAIRFEYPKEKKRKRKKR